MSEELIMKELAKLISKKKPVEIPPETTPSKVVDVVKAQLANGQLQVAHPSVIQYMKKFRKEVKK